MGTDRPTFPHDGEGPARWMEVDAFRIDAYAVTNARFAAFVLATGHRTDAERDGAAFVFQGRLPPPVRNDPRRAPPVPGLPWWRVVPGACWYAPEGPGSDLADRADHPVVHVSWRDARAFADWARGRLPREVEWERAARGGRDGTVFPWGDDLEPDGRHVCNVWQGRFPEEDEGLDGYRGTAPVDAFPANGFGLHQPVGNVWEWCDDRFDPSAPPDAIGARRVQKGGSYLCHASYCDRYRPAARSANDERAATGHAGFRLAYDP
jgi:formylglycine-generating enzyme required for sulfatase activity